MAGCGVRAIRVWCPYRLSGTAAVAYVRTELLTRNVGISIMIETSGSTVVSKRVTGGMYAGEARRAVRSDLLRVVEVPARAADQVQ